MQTIGLDLGFRQVKASANKDFKFDSIIGYPSAIEVQDKRSALPLLKDLQIKHGNTVYYIGEKALRDTKTAQLTFNADKTDSVTDELKTMAALGYVMEKEEEDFRMVTGLPVDELGIEGLQDKMEKNMTKSYSFTLNGVQKKANVKKVDIIAQAAGAYYDYILDEHGNLIKERIHRKTIVIDVGFRTTDIVCMEYARYVPSESFTIYTGVHHIHNELRKLILKEFRVQKHMTEMDSITRQRNLYLQDKRIDIREHILKATFPYAEQILSELPLVISNIKEANQFLITGGGGILMQHLFKSGLTPELVHLMKDSEASNARGYRKYLKLLARNEK